MKHSHFSDFSKSGFTLTELLLSIVILVIIFTYLYSSFNLAKKTTAKVSETNIFSEQREHLINLLYRDIIQAYKVEPTTSNNYDKLDLETVNSLYDIHHPYVKYRVLAQEEYNVLVRLESHNTIEEKSNGEFYMDRALDKITYFKIVNDGANKIEIFISSEQIKDIHLTIVKPSI